jgi:Brp/Blh family beta-carotene 15,15'-monooxygenase
MLALILFVIYSAYHFGEQHWQRYFESTPALLKFLFFTSYGLTILGLIFILNPEEVSIVVRDITGINYSGWFLKEVLIIAGALTVISYTIAAYKAPKLIQSIPKELFLLLIFALIFHSASLIWGFTIYFIFWHSIPSLCDQVRFIHKDLSFKAFKAYGLSALPYWLVSMGGLVALYMLFNDQKYFISLFFAFIAAVTFPHTLVIAGMFNKNNTD